MNGQAKLSYGQIQSIADQLNDASNKMETLLEEIKVLFAKIGTDGVWSGTSASETKAEFDTLSSKFPEFLQTVIDCRQHLLNVLERYQSVDAAIQGN